MNKMKSLLFTTLVMMMALSLVLSVSASSVFGATDTYPNKPVRLVIPNPPGGSPDIIARIIAPLLSERLGKQVVVEYHGGAAGILGTELVAKSKPDGYTLLMLATSQAVNPSFYDVPFDFLKDLVPVAQLATSPYILVVHPGVPANSVQELIGLAKKAPGKMIFAGSGGGAFIHLLSELFRLQAGIDIKVVQFVGTGPALIDLLGGHSQAMFHSVIATLPHIQSGKLRALGITEKKRSPVLPDLPTIAESGLPEFEAAGWFGIVAPAGTPKEIIDRLNKELAVVLDSAKVKKVLEDQATEPELVGPAEFGKHLTAEVAKWAKVIKDANIDTEKKK